jgi:hypothetical protein
MVCARGYRALQAHSGLVRESCLPRSPPGRRDVQPGLDVCTHTLPDRSRPNRTIWTAAGVSSVPFAPIHRRVLLAEGTEGEAQRVRGGARDTETGAFTLRFHWTPVEHRFFLGGNARTGTYTRATPPTSKLKEAMGVPAQVVRILISEPKRLAAPQHAGRRGGLSGVWETARVLYSYPNRIWRYISISYDM